MNTLDRTVATQYGDWETRQMGDLNYDGTVDRDDFFILRDAFNAAGLSIATSVPEPSSLLVVLMVLSMTSAVRFR